ncbi:MAG: hypothetical protein WC716_12120 [Chitinophagaceae bacterium]|jgi:hypothetical protein
MPQQFAWQSGNKAFVLKQANEWVSQNHWVEHKVVHYLLHHHILEHFRMGVWFKTKILRIRPKPVVVVVEDNTPANEHNPNAPYNEPE